VRLEGGQQPGLCERRLAAAARAGDKEHAALLAWCGEVHDGFIDWARAAGIGCAVVVGEGTQAEVGVRQACDGGGHLFGDNGRDLVAADEVPADANIARDHRATFGVDPRFVVHDCPLRRQIVGA
jgi:hypothetical protein